MQLSQAFQSGSASVLSWLNRRRILVILATILIGLGMFQNWSWLVAVGVAPIIVALAPCAVMCGLGFCMMRCTDKSSSSGGGGTADVPVPKIGEN